jgi:hypothetical protein
MVTKDVRFAESDFHAFRNLVSRSTLISGTGEKERNKFFRLLKEKVRALKDSLRRFNQSSIFFVIFQLMNATTDLQQQLFNFIKSSQPHISLADELCDLLEISHDSAYTSYQGRKASFSLSELKWFREKYNIALDQVLQLNSGAVVFKSSDGSSDIRDLKTYLERCCGRQNFFNAFQQKEMLVLAKDFAVFRSSLYLKLLLSNVFSGCAISCLMKD